MVLPINTLRVFSFSTSKRERLKSRFQDPPRRREMERTGMSFRRITNVVSSPTSRFFSCVSKFGVCLIIFMVLFQMAHFGGIHFLEHRELKFNKSLSETNSFQWKCSDSCDCLPPTYDDTSEIMYFHSSYKTLDRKKWSPSWGFCSDEWLRLHPQSSIDTRKVLHLFWMDEHNELLAKCLGVHRIYQSFERNITRADFSRVMYMTHYGGLYHDMDVCPLVNVLSYLEEHYPSTVNIFLQGRTNGSTSVAMEWGVTRHRNDPFWTKFMRKNLKNPADIRLFSYGPLRITAFWNSYAKSNPEVVETNRILVVPPQIVTPMNFNGISSHNFTFCTPDVLLRQPEKTWLNFSGSPCHLELIQSGAIVFSSYTASWTTARGAKRAEKRHKNCVGKSCLGNQGEATKRRVRKNKELDKSRVRKNEKVDRQALEKSARGQISEEK